MKISLSNKKLSLWTAENKENQLPLVRFSNHLIKMTVPRTFEHKENCLSAVPISNLLNQKLSSWTSRYKENQLSLVLISNLLIKMTVPRTVIFIRSHLHSCRFFGRLRRLRGRRRVFQMLQGHRLQVILLIVGSSQVQ